MTEMVLYYTFIIVNLSLLGLHFKNDCWRGQKLCLSRTVTSISRKEGFKFTGKGIK